MFIQDVLSKIVLNIEDQEDQDTSTVSLAEKPKLKKPPLYRVLIFNDDYTPMEFVVNVLRQFFYMSEDKATLIMLKVHKEGMGVCGVFSKDVAATKVEQVIQFSRKNQHL